MTSAKKIEIRSVEIEKHTLKTAETESRENRRRRRNRDPSQSPKTMGLGCSLSRLGKRLGKMKWGSERVWEGAIYRRERVRKCKWNESEMKEWGRIISTTSKDRVTWMTAFRHVHRGILYDRSHLHRPICLSAFATSAWAAVAGHAVHLRRVSNFLVLTTYNGPLRASGPSL